MPIYSRDGQPILSDVSDLFDLVPLPERDQATAIGISVSLLRKIKRGHRPKRSTAGLIARYYNRARRLRAAGIRLDHQDVLGLIAERRAKVAPGKAEEESGSC